MKIWTRDEGKYKASNPSTITEGNGVGSVVRTHVKKGHEFLVCYAQCGFFFPTLTHAQQAD